MNSSYESVELSQPIVKVEQKSTDFLKSLEKTLQSLTTKIKKSEELNNIQAKTINKPYLK